MKKSSSEQQPRIRKQFDSFCKTLLKNEMIDYERERNYRLKYEISFSSGMSVQYLLPLWEEQREVRSPHP